jgi:hypothetical protein
MNKFLILFVIIISKKGINLIIVINKLNEPNNVKEILLILEDGKS